MKILEDIFDSQEIELLSYTVQIMAVNCHPILLPGE